LTLGPAPTVIRPSWAKYPVLVDILPYIAFDAFARMVAGLI
jgi:hypothetical protein